MNQQKKRRVEGKCTMIRCAVTEKILPGLDAYECTCRCGKTWYKSFCGKHELSDLGNMSTILSKQFPNDSSLSNTKPTTRILKNKTCKQCSKNGKQIVVESTEFKVESICILRYECENDHIWYTDVSGITRRDRADMLIKKITPSDSVSSTTGTNDSTIPMATSRRNNEKKCRTCKSGNLSESSCTKAHEISLKVMKCPNCPNIVYYACPFCNGCCRKESRHVVHHVRREHKDMLSETLSISAAGNSIDQDPQAEDALDGFSPDDCYNATTNEGIEEEPFVEWPALMDREETQKEAYDLKAVAQDQEVRDFIKEEKNWGRKCSGEFFAQNFAGNDGLLNLVNNATKQTVETMEDRDYHLFVTKFVNDLRQSQRPTLVKVFNLSIDRLKKKRGAETPLTDANELESKYISGKKSIKQNLPVPSVSNKNQNTGFVMISSKEIVNHLLARGTPLKEYEWKKKSHWWNERGEFHFDILREIRENIEQMTSEVPDDLIVHIVYLWSDSFQKNSLIQTKATDLQIFTAYFVPPDNIRDIKKYTQPLAIGIKRKDHQETLVAVLDEMLSIGKVEKRYCARRCKMVHVIIVRTTIQNDNPERRNNTQTLNIGKIHKRWKYSCQLTNAIPSCRNCYLRRLAKVVDHGLDFHEDQSGKCSTCGDWWLDFDNKKSWFEKPKDYPKKKCANSPTAPMNRDINNMEKYLKPVELTFDFLTTAYNFALHNHMHCLWNKGQFDAYLNTCCFHGGLVAAMKEAVEAVQEKHGSMASVEHIQPPEVWKKYKELKLDLDEFADTPMHMLFLGITKHLLSNLKRLFKSASQNKLYIDFLKVINTALESCKAQSISWCRCLSLSSGTDFGTQGWQSDHFAGLSRLSLVFFAYLDDVTASDASKDYEFQKSLASFKQMLVLWNCLLSELFTNEECDPERVDHYARLFLSACCVYGKQTVKGGKKALYFEGTTNYFSLLNLKDLVKKHGDMRKLWEGEREKYIKFVKRVLTKLPQNDTFLTTAMTELLQSHCLDQLMEDNQYTSNETYERLSVVKVYNTVESLCENHWYKGKPLRGVTLKGCSDIFLCIKIPDGIGLYPAKFLDEYGCSKYNMWYAPLYIEGMKSAPSYLQNVTPQHIIPSKEILKTQLSDTVIIHAMVKAAGKYEGKNGHTVISRNWKVRSTDGCLRKLRPIGETFKELHCLTV